MVNALLLGTAPLDKAVRNVSFAFAPFSGSNVWITFQTPLLLSLQSLIDRYALGSLAFPAHSLFPLDFRPAT